MIAGLVAARKNSWRIKTAATQPILTPHEGESEIESKATIEEV